MNEKLNQPNPEHWSDERPIDHEIASATSEERSIGDAGARVIASQWHGGQASALYSLTSTGAIDLPQVVAEINECWANADTDYNREHLEALGAYVMARESHDPVEGWSKQWLTSPDKSTEQDDFCPACRAHMSAPHSVGCPLGEEDPELLKQVEQAVTAKGIAVAHWLEYVGFRNGEELEAAIDMFEDHYLGHFESIEAYAADYLIESGLEAQLDQLRQYLPEDMRQHAKWDEAGIAHDFALNTIHSVEDDDGHLYLFTK